MSQTAKSKTENDSFTFSQTPLDMTSRFLPATQMLGHFTEAARILMQAEIAFGQELMRANLALFSAFSQTRDAALNERPSVAAIKPEVVS
jgi:hypothetical protein